MATGISLIASGTPRIILNSPREKNTQIPTDIRMDGVWSIHTMGREHSSEDGQTTVNVITWACVTNILLHESQMQKRINALQWSIKLDKTHLHCYKLSGDRGHPEEHGSARHVSEEATLNVQPSWDFKWIQPQPPFGTKKNHLTEPSQWWDHER